LRENDPSAFAEALRDGEPQYDQEPMEFNDFVQLDHSEPEAPRVNFAGFNIPSQEEDAESNHDQQKSNKRAKNAAKVRK